MITNAIFHFFSTILDGILSLLPTVSPPDLTSPLTDIASGFGGPLSYLGWANQYFPLAEAIAIAGVLLATWLIMYALDFVLWALTKIHVLGGSS